MKSKNSIFSIRIVILVLPVLCSCGIFSGLFSDGTALLEIGIPHLPDFWKNVLPDAVQYHVTVSCRGERFQYDVSEERSGDYTWLSVPVREGSTIAITAVPEIRYNGESYTLYSAGAVYPDDCSNAGVVRLSWEHGFIAGIIETLCLRSFPIDRLNIERIRSSVNKRSNNPWLLDREKLLEAILDGSLNGYSIKKKERYTVKIPLPAGLWVSEDPLGELLLAVDGNIVSWTVTAGKKKFFRLDGDPCAASFTVNTGGYISVFRLDPCDEQTALFRSGT